MSYRYNVCIEKKIEYVIKSIKRFSYHSRKMFDLNICMPIITETGLRFYFEYDGFDAFEANNLHKHISSLKYIDFHTNFGSAYYNKKMIGYYLFEIKDLHYLDLSKSKLIRKIVDNNNCMDYTKNELCNDKLCLEFYNPKETFLCKFIELYSDEKEEKYLSLIKKLLDDNYDIYEKDICGYTPMKLTKIYGLEDITELLEKKIYKSDTLINNV